MLKGDRAFILTYLDGHIVIFDFSHLQEVNWCQSWTKNSNFGYIPCLCKISSFSKCFKWHLCNYENYLWSEFQLNLMLFFGSIALTPPLLAHSKKKPSWDLNQKNNIELLLGKVENDKYTETET